MLWCYWLGSRKGIRPVKNWVVGYWRGYLPAARYRLAYGPADATATHCLLLHASVKSRLVLPFWYRLTQLVPDKGVLNGCVWVWWYWYNRTQEVREDYLTFSTPTRPLSIISTSRPGVATSRWQPRARSRICPPMSAPPYTTHGRMCER